MKEFKTINQNKADIEIGYKEQKQHLIDIMKSDEELGLYEQIDQNNPVTKGSTALVKEIKFEDVFNDEKRENIKKFIDEIENPSEPNQALIDAAERYSEEDLKNAFFEGWIARDGDLSFTKAKNKWFEQFKKK